jgi:hypothetical protein
MSLLPADLVTRIKRKAWTRLLGERSWFQRHGDFRTRERYGLIERAGYLYGMLRAADVAKYFGKKRVTAIEFGVASGGGLLNMIELAPQIQRETGVELRIIGFDTGRGLPAVQGYKDHPELWKDGDFATADRDALVRRLAGRAEMIWGDINDTVGPCAESIDESAPLGFVSVDVDIYTATRGALHCLTGQPEKYNPAVSMYFDDVTFFFANRWAGELAAIEEFNQEHELRKIGPDLSLGRRPVTSDAWYPNMYACHILDHPTRQSPRDRPQLSLEAHYEFMASQFLF